MERERRERRVAAGASAADDQACGIGLALLDEKPRRVDAVVDVHDAPVQVEAFTIRAAVTRTAAVVHVGHGKATARPELHLQVQHRLRLCRRSAVADDDERRAIRGQRAECGVARRVVERVRRDAAFGRKFDRFGHRHVLTVERQRRGRTQQLRATGHEVRAGDRWRGVG